MSKIYIIILFVFISNCTLNKVIKHHGVHALEKKQLKLTKKVSNKKMKNYFDYSFKFPTYVEGLNYVRDNFI